MPLIKRYDISCRFFFHKFYNLNLEVMKSKLSSANKSFSHLRGSSEFLNLVLDNISSCILLLDKNMRLHAFNDSLKTIFSNKKDEHLLYMKCGDAIGCASQVDEKSNCGKSEQCKTCDLRLSALNAYALNKVVYKSRVTRQFYDHNGKKVDKHLQFSTKPFRYNNEKYIIMIIEDITKFVEIEKENAVLREKLGM